MSSPELGFPGICCGWQRRLVAVSLYDETLAIVICDICRQRQWLRDGVPISNREALRRAVKSDRRAPQIADSSS
jgi:hypothetical protein